MKFYYKIIILLLLPFSGFSQNLNDVKTFKESYALAKENDKAILLIINVAFPSNIDTKGPENLGIKDKEVRQKIKDNFIVYETNRTDTSITRLIATYKIDRFPAYIFIHHTKDVFYRDFGASPTKHKFLAMIDQALKQRKEKSMVALQSEYIKNPNDFALLKQLIQLRKKNGLTDNAPLIEKYINGLKIGDLNDYQTVLFILEAGPYVDGNAYKLAYTNRKIIDSIYRNEPLALRTTINNTIISNTMLSAIRTKNRTRAQSAANFARNTWNNDFVKGNKTYGTQMLYFFSSIKDTANYFKTAVQHMDMYYMNISADSVKKLDEKERLASKDKIMPLPGVKTVSKAKIDSIMKANPSNVQRRTESMIIGSPVSLHSSELNNVASRFYTMGTKNLNYLSKAMLWSKRSIELKPVWIYYDTLAHIYYAMGIHNEALATQKIALDLVVKENNPSYTARVTKEYEKMMDKTL